MTDDDGLSSFDAKAQAVATHMLFEALVTFMIRRRLMDGADYDGVVTEALSVLDRAQPLPPVFERARQMLLAEAVRRPAEELH